MQTDSNSSRAQRFTRAFSDMASRVGEALADGLRAVRARVRSGPLRMFSIPLSQRSASALTRLPAAQAPTGQSGPQACMDRAHRADRGVGEALSIHIRPRVAGSARAPVLDRKDQPLAGGGRDDKSGTYSTTLELAFDYIDKSGHRELSEEFMRNIGSDMLRKLIVTYLPQACRTAMDAIVADLPNALHGLNPASGASVAEEVEYQLAVARQVSEVVSRHLGALDPAACRWMLTIADRMADRLNAIEKDPSVRWTQDRCLGLVVSRLFVLSGLTQKLKEASGNVSIVKSKALGADQANLQAARNVVQRLGSGIALKLTLHQGRTDLSREESYALERLGVESLQIGAGLSQALAAQVRQLGMTPTLAAATALPAPTQVPSGSLPR